MSIVLLILGLLLGPGYYVYTRYFTGQVVATQALPLAGTRIEATNVAVRPDMNPIGLVLRFSAAHGQTINPPDTPRNAYRARLVDGERVVLDERFSLISSLVESAVALQFQQALPLFDAERAANYRLELSLDGDAQMQVSSVDVQVRAGMRAPDLRVVAAGLVLLVLGVVGVLRT